MRATFLLACCLLTCSACGLTRTSKPDQPPPPPIKRERVVEPIRCNVPETPVPAPARAQDADGQATEEHMLTGAYTQAVERLRAMWECVNKHNERSGK
jgi:hypothetical protein